MRKIVSANQPMRLQGTKNTRDLGGYPTVWGTNTVNGAFLRSDSPNFTDRDKDILYRYGVRLTIDLRGANEVKRFPSALLDYKDIEYLNIQLLDSIMSDATGQSMPATLLETYLDLLDNSQPAFQKMFKKILEHPDAAALINCTAGKDRTGVVTMLLLKTAGVPDEFIVADYEATYFNIKEDKERSIAMMQQIGLTPADHLFYSEPENMIQTLKYLNDNYGTIDDYLQTCGLAVDEIDALRNKLLGK